MPKKLWRCKRCKAEGTPGLHFTNCPIVSPMKHAGTEEIHDVVTAKLKAAATTWGFSACGDEADIAFEQALTESGLIGLLGDLAEQAFRFSSAHEVPEVHVRFQSDITIIIPLEAE